MRGLTHALVLASACVALAASPAEAQRPDPQRTGASGGGAPNPFWRLQVAHPAQWPPVLGVGPLLKIPLGKTPRRPEGATGPVVIAARNWYVYALPTVGLNTDDPGRPTFTGTLGIVRRRSGPIDRVGAMAFGSLQPRTLGPVLRLEALNGVVAVQPGWVWREDDRNGFVVALDVSIPFLRDAILSK